MVNIRIHDNFIMLTNTLVYKGMCRSSLIGKQQLSSGDWNVLDQSLWVNQKVGLNYFMDLRDFPLTTHLYVMSYARPGSNFVRLKHSGYSRKVSTRKVISCYSPLLPKILRGPSVYIGMHSLGNRVQQYPMNAYLPSCGLETGR